MVRTSAFAKLVSAVLFAAVCAYLLAHFAQVLDDSRRAVLTEKTVTDSIALEGIALRSEQTVCLEGEPVLFCENGERLAAGQIFAEQNGESLISDASAIFFGSCDGYEYLAPNEDGFSAECLNKLLAAERRGDSAAGRLVKGRTWYFAAVAEAKDVACGEVTVKFGDLNEKISCTLVRSCPDGKGKTAVLLKIRIGKNEYLSLRRCRGEIILKETTGLAVPVGAVAEENGNYFVIRLTAAGEKVCPAEILYKNEDFFLIRPTEELYSGAKVKIKMQNAE